MISRKHYTQHKEKARKMITEEVYVVADFYSIPIKKLAIRNQRTRWGSCSHKGNLNFNYKIAFLPADLRTTVIVHEICHLIEFNHSKHFWDQVARYLPNYKELTKQLRKLDMRLLQFT